MYGLVPNLVVGVINISTSIIWRKKYERKRIYKTCKLAENYKTRNREKIFKCISENCNKFIKQFRAKLKFKTKGMQWKMPIAKGEQKQSDIVWIFFDDNNNNNVRNLNQY